MNIKSHTFELYFQSDDGTVRLLREIRCETEEDARREAVQEICEFCNQRNFRIHYLREWQEEFHGQPATVFDVGSHTEFFILQNNELNSM